MDRFITSSDEGPTHEFSCKVCSKNLARWRGQESVTCTCGAEYTPSGQQIRSDWRSNPSYFDDDISDLEGFEIQHASY